MPQTFDARKKWGTCIHGVRDQGNCGSCFAFSSVGMIEDRFCIQTKGSIDSILSPNYMVSCDTFNFGCDGGYLENALFFLEDEGVVTERCDPYDIGVSGHAADCPS